MLRGRDLVGRSSTPAAAAAALQPSHRARPENGRQGPYGSASGAPAQKARAPWWRHCQYKLNGPIGRMVSVSPRAIGAVVPLAEVAICSIL
jgi:hypothetical protein